MHEAKHEYMNAADTAAENERKESNETIEWKRERENEHCKCVAFHWILLLYATMFLKLYTSAPYTVHRQCILYIWWNFALLSRFNEAKKNPHMTLQRRTKQTFGSDKFCTRTFFCPLKTANFALFHFQNSELCANSDVSVFACSVYSDIWFEFGFEFHWQNIMSNERRHSFWQCDLYIWIFRVSERECTVHAWVQIPTLLSLSLTCKF